MKLEIRFRHMERSEALEDYATEKITQSLEHVLHRDEAHVQAWLISERNLTNRGTGWFICEIDVRVPPRKEIFVRKSGPEIHGAIQSAIDKMQLLLDEQGKRENCSRKQSAAALGASFGATVEAATDDSLADTNADSLNIKEGFV